MKNLTTLIAVAALATFSWANVAEANDIDAPEAVCVILGDFVLFVVEDLFVGEEDRAISARLACGDPLKGRMHAVKKVILEEDCEAPPEACFFGIDIDEIKGSSSLKEGDICMGSVKYLHDGGPNKNGLTHIQCINP